MALNNHALEITVHGNPKYVDDNHNSWFKLLAIPAKKVFTEFWWKVKENYQQKNKTGALSATTCWSDAHWNMSLFNQRLQLNTRAPQ